MGWLKLRFLFFIVALTLTSFSECAKILGILHVPGHSHYQAGSTLLKILAEHGHEVTVVNPFGEKNPPKNYKDVIMTDSRAQWEKKNPNFFDKTVNPIAFPIIFNYIAGGLVEDLYNGTNFQNLMKSGEHFDLVIIEQFGSDALKYIAQHFKAPLIVYTALDTNEWINPYQGNPDNPSYIPHMLLKYKNTMTFCQRVISTLMYVYSNFVRVFLHIPNQNRILHKYHPNAPDLTEIIDKVALVLSNSDPSTHEPTPKVPSIISIGGFHIKKPKPLPKDIKDILDGAKNGVIIFSMGSNLKSKDMPKEKIEMFIKTFAKLKETVIWKFEDENLEGKPENVIIRKWLPQNDMFAHKNVKLFITHGGIFSTMEAVYHGIPLLAMPIFGDQAVNAQRATANGYAKFIDFKTLSAEKLESSLKELLTDPKYTENVKIRSRIMQDKPMEIQETINFWVDYVIRHKGADHLRVASLNLSWYQNILLDVVLFIIVISLGIFIISLYLIRKFVRFVSRKKGSKQKTS